MADFPTGLTVAGVLGGGDGTVSLPGYSFTADTDSGIYRIGANNIGVAVNGAKVVDITTTGLNSTVIGATTPAAGTFTTASATSGMVLPKTTTTGIKVDTTTPTWGWRDITSEIDARGSGGNDPTFSTYTGTNFFLHQFSATTMQQVYITFHVPHDYVPGTDIYIHAHWSNAAAAPNTGNVIWGFEYSYAKGHGQEAFPASTTVTVTQACPATRYYHNIAETTAITIAGLEVDGLIMVRAYRDAAAGGDTCTDAVFVHTVDIHYQSTNMATKAKAPNFYG